MRGKAKTLNEIETVRAMQRLAAEAKAQKSSKASRLARELLEESERERSTVAENWQRSASASSISLEVTQLWSGALLKSETTIRQRAHDAAKALEELDASRIAWQASVAQHDHASRLARTARRNELERQDERALQDVLDRHVESAGP